jgi:hypothetical protein
MIYFPCRCWQSTLPACWKWGSVSLIDTFYTTLRHHIDSSSMQVVSMKKSSRYLGYFEYAGSVNPSLHTLPTLLLLLTLLKWLGTYRTNSLTLRLTLTCWKCIKMLFFPTQVKILVMVKIMNVVKTDAAELLPNKRRKERLNMKIGHGLSSLASQKSQFFK